MPLVADTLDALFGSSIFQPLTESQDIGRSSSTPLHVKRQRSLRTTVCMSFGFTNSGASFQLLMGHLLRGLEY